MSFIKVLTDVDGEVYSLPARIVSTNSDGSFNIQYLSKTEKKHSNGKSIYEYEIELYNITEESIDEYMYDENEGGFKTIEDGLFIRESSSIDDDDDYVPSSEYESEESDVESEESDAISDEDCGDDDFED
jgi:hypothetical protein